MKRKKAAIRSLRIPNSIATIFLSPESRTRKYFQVEIYKTEKSMQRALGYFVSPKPKRISEIIAYTHAVEPTVGDPIIGIVYLSRNRLDHTTISHELFHCSMRWVNVMRFRPETVTGWNMATHERVAEAHARMSNKLFKSIEQITSEE